MPPSSGVLSTEWKEFLESLNKKGAHYLIIGAVALAVHGCPRMTGDLDILIEASLENAKKVIEALREFGFSDLSLKEEDLLEPGYVIQIGFPPNRIDLHTSAPLPFEELFRERIEIEIEGIKLSLVSREHLIKIKEKVGRVQDLADVRCLKRRKMK